MIMAPLFVYELVCDGQNPVSGPLGSVMHAAVRMQRSRCVRISPQRDTPDAEVAPVECSIWFVRWSGQDRGMLDHERGSQ